MDIVHTGDRFVIRVELPGIDPKDVDVSIRGRVLIVKGARKVEQEAKDEHYFAREIPSGEFERSVTLPEGADVKNITAVFKNGILEISMPAAGMGEARKVEVVSG